MDHSECHRIAAVMMCGSRFAEPGLLHAGLYDTLTSIDELCGRCDGRLVSRQIIAAVILQWQRENVDAQPYGDEG